MDSVLRLEFQREIQNRVFKSRPDWAPITKTGLEVPWSFDFRTILLEPKWLNQYAELFWSTYADQYPFQVGGSETAGIPLVAAIVMKSKEKGLPVNGFFIRKSRKKHGLLNIIEGTLTNKPIILVDDLINSGQTLNRLLLILEEDRKTITDIFTLLTFRPKDAYRFATDKGISVRSVFSLEDFGLPFELSLGPQIPSASFRILWRFKSEQPSYQYVVEKSAPVLDAERVYFGSDQGILWALNQEDGSVAWKYKVGFHPKGKGIFSDPALSNGILYFGAYDGNVYALDAKTGTKKWMFMEADWVGSSPAPAPELGLLFIGLEFGLWKRRGGIVALNLATGEKRWDFSMPEFTHSSPLYIPEQQIVVIGSNDGKVYCFEARKGRLRWTAQTGGPIKSSLAYDLKQRTVIFGSLDGNMYALKSEDGSVAWKFETSSGIFSTPLVHNDLVFAASLDKNIYALHAQTGEKVWSFATTGRIFATPVIADGSLWIGSNDGRLYELNPHSGALRSFFQATERIVNAIAHNAQSRRIYLPTQANELYCIEKRENT